MTFSIVLVEKFRKETKVRVFSTFPTKTLAEQARSRISFAGKRGDAFIVEDKDLAAFTAQHQVLLKSEREVAERQRRQQEQARAIARERKETERIRLRREASGQALKLEKAQRLSRIESARRSGQITSREATRLRLRPEISRGDIKALSSTKVTRIRTRFTDPVEIIQDVSQRAFGVLSSPFNKQFDGQVQTETRTPRGFVTFRSPETVVKTKDEIITSRQELRIPSFKPTETFRVETPKQRKERKKSIRFKAEGLLVQTGQIVKEKGITFGQKLKDIIPKQIQKTFLPLTAAFVVGRKKLRDITGKLPTTKSKLIRTDLPFREFEAQLPQQLRRDKSTFRERLGIQLARTTAITGFGFGRTFEFARERPLEFAGTLAAIQLGVPLAARGVAGLTGVSLRTGKSIVGLGLLGGFGAVKEIREPGSITTVAGGLGTVTEFGTFALAAKGAGVAVRGTRILTDPRFIPFIKTSPEGGPGIFKTGKTKPPSPTKDISSIRLFVSGTRTGTAAQEALSGTARARQQFFTTTAVTKEQFFGGAVSRGAKEIIGVAPKFKVEKPSLQEVGPDRAKFEEFGLFLGRGEAFTVFGETGVGRLGSAEVRTSVKEIKDPLDFRIAGERIGRFFSQQRTAELFARTATPTILRFPTGQVTRFPPRLEKKIREGSFGPELRRELGREIKRPESIGKIFAGPRTAGLGFGEQEFLIPPESKIFLLKGQPPGGRFTFSPNLGQFQNVIDVGLRKGISPTGPFNIRGRVKNVVGIGLEEILGIRTFGIEGLPKGKSIVERLTVQRKTISEVRKVTPSIQRPSIVRRVPTRDRIIDRVVGRERIRERPRERVRERPRERIRERPRERVRDRVREVTRLRVRERPRERPRERVRERFRFRERIRGRERVRPRITITPTPPPSIIRLPRRGRIEPPQKTKKKERKRRFRGTPSLSFILTGKGTQLTARQIAGTEAISPFQIRAIGRRR